MDWGSAFQNMQMDLSFGRGGKKKEKEAGHSGSRDSQLEKGPDTEQFHGSSQSGPLNPMASSFVPPQRLQQEHHKPLKLFGGTMDEKGVQNRRAKGERQYQQRDKSDNATRADKQGQNAEGEAGKKEEKSRERSLEAMPGFGVGRSGGLAKPSRGGGKSTEAMQRREERFGQPPRNDNQDQQNVQREREEKPAQEENVDHEQRVVGTCEDMCPLAERERREMEMELDRLEKLNGEERTSKDLCVKKFVRNFQGAPDPSQVRTEAALEKTLKHLWNLLDHPHLPFASVYPFVWDRVRSVRQDLMVQGMSSRFAVRALEEITRFHIVAQYELGADRQTISNPDAFSPHLNIEQLNKTLVSLTSMYRDFERAGEGLESEPEFQSYLLILSMHPHGSYKTDEATFKNTLRSLRPATLRSRDVQFAISCSSAIHSGNYQRFLQLLSTSSYTHACLLSVYLPQVRRKFLQLLRQAASGKVTMPLSVVVRRLRLRDEDHACALLQYHNLQVEKSGGEFCWTVPNNSLALPPQDFRDHTCPGIDVLRPSSRREAVEDPPSSSSPPIPRARSRPAETTPTKTESVVDQGEPQKPTPASQESGSPEPLGQQNQPLLFEQPLSQKFATSASPFPTQSSSEARETRDEGAKQSGQPSDDAPKRTEERPRDSVVQDTGDKGKERTSEENAPSQRPASDQPQSSFNFLRGTEAIEEARAETQREKEREEEERRKAVIRKERERRFKEEKRKEEEKRRQEEETQRFHNALKALERRNQSRRMKEIGRAWQHKASLLAQARARELQLLRWIREANPAPSWRLLRRIDNTTFERASDGEKHQRTRVGICRSVTGSIDFPSVVSGVLAERKVPAWKILLQTGAESGRDVTRPGMEIAHALQKCFCIGGGKAGGSQLSLFTVPQPLHGQGIPRVHISVQEANSSASQESHSGASCLLFSRTSTTESDASESERLQTLIEQVEPDARLPLLIVDMCAHEGEDLERVEVGDDEGELRGRVGNVMLGGLRSLQKGLQWLASEASPMLILQEHGLSELVHDCFEYVEGKLRGSLRELGQEELLQLTDECIEAALEMARSASNKYPPGWPSQEFFSLPRAEEDLPPVGWNSRRLSVIEGAIKDATECEHLSFLETVQESASWCRRVMAHRLVRAEAMADERGWECSVFIEPSEKRKVMNCRLLPLVSKFSQGTSPPQAWAEPQRQGTDDEVVQTTSEGSPKSSNEEEGRADLDRLVQKAFSRFDAGVNEERGRLERLKRVVSTGEQMHISRPQKALKSGESMNASAMRSEVELEGARTAAIRARVHELLSMNFRNSLR